MIEFNTKEELDAYVKGYKDAVSYDKAFSHTISFMGYTIEQLVKVINEYKHTPRQNREGFRAKLADLGEVEHTKFSSKVLEAYDLVHCPELREEKGLPIGFKFPWSNHISWSECVNSLREQGWKIIKDNQK